MTVTLSNNFTGRIERGNSHRYLIDNREARGVTTILNGGLPKPALITWAGNTVAEAAVDNWRALSKLPPSKRLKELKAAPFANRDAAGKQGTLIHRIAEQLVNGQTVDVIPAGLSKHIESAKQFLLDWEIELIASELPVFNRSEGYAGTIDLIGKSGNLTYLFDLKTNRSGVFADAAYQTVAYRKCEFTLDEAGNEIPLPPIDRCAIVHIRPDGYSVWEVTESLVEEIYDYFLHIMSVAEAVRESDGFLSEIQKAS